MKKINNNAKNRDAEMRHMIYAVLCSYKENEIFTIKDLYDRLENTYEIDKLLTENYIYNYVEKLTYNEFDEENFVSSPNLALVQCINKEKDKNERKYKINIDNKDYIWYQEYKKEEELIETIEKLKNEINELKKENVKLKRQVKGLCIANNRKKKIIEGKIAK